MILTKKRIIIFLILIIFGLYIIFISLYKKMMGEKKNMIFKVEGFEVEYNLTSSKIAVEDLDSIELGSSIYEIRDKLGEPDSWIGSGMLRPVYFLEDRKVVVFHFEYPAVCDGLNQIVLIDQCGNIQIIKEK